jgi:imidazolonepropionase-like amidohydrolase
MRKRFHASFQKLVFVMHKSGVPILAGTDFGGRDLYPGFSLHDELAQLVESGLTSMEALQAATCTPAKFLKLDSELGSIAEGYTANLVLLSKNPLDDIANTTSIQAVVFRGRYLDRAELDRLLTASKEKAARL